MNAIANGPLPRLACNPTYQSAVLTDRLHRLLEAVKTHKEEGRERMADIALEKVYELTGVKA